MIWRCNGWRGDNAGGAKKLGNGEMVGGTGVEGA